MANMPPMVVLLFMILCISFELAQSYSISYIDSTMLTKSCTVVCNKRGLSCHDEDMLAMNCPLAAERACEEDMTRYDNLAACNRGCLVSCSSKQYSTKRPEYCSTLPECPESYNVNQISRVCACRKNGNSGSSTEDALILTVGEVIGIACAVFFFLIFVLAICIYAYQIYTQR